MKKVSLLLLLLISLCWPPSSEAGKFNPQVSPGDPAPEFSNLPGVDGKTYSTADFSSAPVLVIAFTCNTCPYAVDYEARLTALTKKYQAAPTEKQQVAVIAINCNLTPADSLEKMRERATEQNFSFVYLFDETQQIARDYGALRTPEFFVLNAERKIVYQGAFDDSTDAAKVEQAHVAEAIEATLAGQSVEITETPPVGCLIRFKRQRR